MGLVYLKTILLGIVVGFLAGVQGNAGTLYILTGLLLLGIVKTHPEAAGIALFYSVTTIFAAYQYYLKNKIDLRIVLVLMLTSIIFSVLGSKLNPYIPKKYIFYSLGSTTLLTSIYFFIKAIKAVKE